MTCRGHASDIEQFARDHEDIVQVIGVGSQDDFGQAIDFVTDTGLGATPMLWEDTGALWRIHDVVNNSSLQLFSHDLTRASQLFFYTDQGRRTVLEAAPVVPWAP